MQKDERFCVWGGFDGHLVEYCHERGFLAEHVPVLEKAKADPVLNRERPRLFRLTPIGGGVGFYVLNVFPGKDYVYHYARLVMQAMEGLKRGSSLTLLVRVRVRVDVRTSSRNM